MGDREDQELDMISHYSNVHSCRLFLCLLDVCEGFLSLVADALCCC